MLLNSSAMPVWLPGVRPEQVDILVTNCSIFSATPSLASMLINKFKFRTDVQSYHLVSWQLLCCSTLA
jgi:3-ketoacyl-CoA synthase